MEQKIIYQDLENIAYADAWDYQKKLLGQVQEIKNFRHVSRRPTTVIFCFANTLMFIHWGKVVLKPTF